MNLVYDAIDSNFVGRDEELFTLFNRISESTKPIIITGQHGIGKTALLQIFRKRFAKKFDSVKMFSCLNNSSEEIDEILQKNRERNDVNNILIMDQAQELPKTKFIKYVKDGFKKYKTRIIFSTSIIYPEIVEKSYILKLSSLPISDMVKVGMKYFQRGSSKNLKHLISDFIDSIDGQQKTPREIILSLNEFLAKNPEYNNYVPDKSIKQGKQYISYEINIIGFIISILLFVYSQKSSSHSEERIINKINSNKDAVTTLISESYKKMSLIPKYYVNRNAKMRNKPNSSSKILEVITKNKILNLVKNERGWYYVYYEDYVESNRKYGWVYCKYLSIIVSE